MSDTRKKLTSFNIHLLKESINCVSDAIVATTASGKAISIKQIESHTIDGAILVYEEQQEKAIQWAGLLQTAFSEVPQFLSKHASAVVFIKAHDRNFVLTFGYGRKLLKESIMVSDFGLKTALCICDEDTLKAVNFRTIEEKTKIGRFQLSDQANVAFFRLETDTDLLRGIEAKSKRTDICESVGAKWSNLIISARADLADIPEICKELLKAYKAENLPDEFSWVNNVKRVNDKLLVDDLTEKLCQLLDDGTYDNIRLAIPEISGATVGTTARLFKEDGKELTSSIEEYLIERPRGVKNTVDAMMNSHKVFLVNDSSNQIIQKISVFKCTVAEVTHSDKLYLLADAEWFALDCNFVTEVNDYISGIPSFIHTMPNWKKKENEGKWNKRAQRAWRNTIHMDGGLIYHGGGHNQIEVADLINRTSKPTLICHVKRIDKHSSGLSHLFGQGAVAAELLSQDNSFRSKVINKTPYKNYGLNKELNKNTFTPDNWVIAYVLLGVSDDRDTIAQKIPFFSRVNLRKHIQRLRSMQFNVALVGIPTEGDS